MSTTTPSPSRRIVGVSLKLYFSLSQTITYLTTITPLSTFSKTLPHPPQIFIIPDLLSIHLASTILSSTGPAPSPLMLGAPDCFWEDSGAFTGEVSPSTLRELGVGIVELGHAERRRLFGENDEQVSKKARAVVRNGMIPLVCIGEKTQGSVPEAVEECTPQIESVLDAISLENGSQERDVIFAYEPVWAIGQPAPASAEYVVAVVKELRGVCEKRGWDKRVRFLYGGSAGPGTFESIKEGVDGLFLGRFAHDLERFRKVIEEIGGAS